MGFRGFLRDRQAQPGSRRPMLRFLSSIESLEDAFPIGGLDWRTLIMHGNDNLSQILLSRDGNRGTGGRVLGRVIDELLQRRRQYLAGRRKPQGEPRYRLPPPAGREAARDTAPGHLRSASAPDGLPPEPDFRRIDPRHLQQLGSQTIQVVRLLVDEGGQLDVIGREASAFQKPRAGRPYRR